MLRQVPEAPPEKPRKARVVQVPEILIHDAAKEGRFGAVEQHIAAGTDVDLRDDKGATPLHYALNKRVAAPLIANAAQVDAKDYNGYTPLFSAAANNRPEVVDLLIREGADVKHKGFAGEEAILYANGESTIEILFKAGLRYTSIHNAVRGGYLEAIKERITSGADINSKLKTEDGSDGATPLWYACFLGHAEVVELLLLNGANAKEKEDHGGSLLHSLHRQKPQAFNKKLNLLIEYGLDITHKDNRGNTALHSFLGGLSRFNEETKQIPYIDTNTLENVKSLIARGVDVNTTNRSFETPLHTVAQNPSLKMAKILIDAGAEIDAIGSIWQSTPFHTAVITRDSYSHNSDSVEMIKELRLMIELFIKKGADVNVTSSQGTALDVLHERNQRSNSKVASGGLTEYEIEYRKIYRLVRESGGRLEDFKLRF